MTKTELLIEIADVRDSITAFKNDLRHLAPAGYADAPGVTWLQIQMRVLQARLSRSRTPGHGECQG